MKNEYFTPFEKFWDLYPKKKSKQYAFEVWHKTGWDKATPEQLDRLYNSVKEHCRLDESWQRNNGRFIPYPHNYLLEGQWEDELKPTPPTEMPQKEKQYYRFDHLLRSSPTYDPDLFKKGGNNHG